MDTVWTYNGGGPFGNPPPLLMSLGFTEDAVEISTAFGAFALCHACTFGIYNYIAARSALCLAFNAIEFALIRIRHNILLVSEDS